MGSMDASERFPAAREGGEAVVSSGRQPSHAAQSRKKSFKTMKAEACLMPTHTSAQSGQHMCSPLHTPAVSLWHTTAPSSSCCLVISLLPLAELVLGLAGVSWSSGIEPVLA